jgi:hypothetical protein
MAIEEPDYNKIYEVKKEVEAVDTMQLVDLNGSKINFQSDCLVSTDDPSKTLLLSIVNQDELDNGEFSFEPSEEGKYARRVTFDENVKKNHFLCIKKHPSDPDEKINCTVIIRMKEIPPRKKALPVKKISHEQRQERQEREERQERQERDVRQERQERSERPERPERNEKNEEREIKMEKESEIKKKLQLLSRDQKYQSLKQKNEMFDREKKENEKMAEKMLNYENEDNDEREDNEPFIPNKKNRMMYVKPEINPYYKISIFCLIMFSVIMIFKVINRK